ncbi:MAG: hypothetical protein U5N85_10145 [Arcicella sp.]|nr:hypothetical protein [Arcicella sp.]
MKIADKNTEIKAEKKRTGRFKSAEEMANFKTQLLMDSLKGVDLSSLQRK